MTIPSRSLRTLAFVIGACSLPGTADADTLHVLGNAGVLGEWELTATVTGPPSGRTRELAGPLTMRHVGLCTQDGPEEKTGEIKVRASGSSPRVEGTLVLEGSDCVFTATLDDSRPGTLTCPDRRAVPLSLSMR